MEDFNFDPVEGLENETTFIDEPLNPRENFMRVLNQIKTFINGILKTAVDGKIPTTAIVNDLTTGGATKVASAEQVKVLKSSVVNNLTSGGTTVPLSAEQGKTLKTLVDGKVAISGTKVLSDENFTTTLKTKLAEIATGATKNEFASVTGTCTVNPNSDISIPVGQVTQIDSIAFPSGYTKDNSIVIAVGRKRDSWAGGYGYGAGVFDASSMVTGCLPASIVFATDGSFGIRFANIGSSTLTILYKITFMKIA